MAGGRNSRRKVRLPRDGQTFREEGPVSTKARGELMLFLITFIWGSTFVTGKIVLAQVSPLQMMVIRFSLSSVIFLALGGRRIFPVSWASVIKAGFLGLLLFLGFAAQTVGLQWTTASKSAFITGMMVVFVPVLQVLVERRAPKIGNILGIVVVAVGLWLMTSPEGGSFNGGDALTLLCAFFFTGYIVYLDMISHEMTALQLTFLHITAAGILSIVAALFVDSLRFSVTSQGVLLLLYLTLFSTVLTTLVQTRFQKETTPTRAAIIFTVEPVVASLLAYAVLGERLGVAGAIGGALIVAGVLVSELSDGVPLLNKPVYGGSDLEDIGS